MAKAVAHKHARQDLRALLEERNHQNAFLRSQLAARIELTTNLEARLLNTLDTLDELQASATRDLEQAQRENALLTRKLEVAQAIARDADMEKSDMSNAVLQLVEKVESCNDYARWRVSRVEFNHDISLHPVRPTKTAEVASSSRDTMECSCAQAYSPAVVEELSDALSKERRAHALSIEEAERRIATLQVRLAARDAENARRVATCRCHPTSASSRADIQLELMSEEEQARIAVHSAQRNRVLESEISLLEEKVKRECRLHRPDPPRRAEQSIQTDLAPASSRFLSPSCRSAGNNARRFTPSDEVDALPTALSALDSHINVLRKSLADLLDEKNALRSALHKELQVDPAVLLSPQHPRQHMQAEHGGNDGNIKANEGIRDGDEFKGVLLLEEECIRLMRSEESLRTSLERLQHREALLSDENARLRDEISRLCNNAEGRPSDRLSPPSLPPLDTSASAVDLAFPPLQPDTISSTYTISEREDDEPSAPDPVDRTDGAGSSSSGSSTSLPATPTSLVDPSEVPLPITPTFDDVDIEEDADGTSEPVALPSPQAQESGPTLPSGPPSDSVRRLDVESIERELADARADAEMRDREIAEVRDYMADLAMRASSGLQGS